MTTEVLSRSAVKVGATRPARGKRSTRSAAVLMAEGLVTQAYLARCTRARRSCRPISATGSRCPTARTRASAPSSEPAWPCSSSRPACPGAKSRPDLVIGLAATSDEHIAILSRLAGILDDAELCERLGRRPTRRDSRGADLAGRCSPGGRRRPGPAARNASLRPDHQSVRAARATGGQVVAPPPAVDADISDRGQRSRANARSITALLGLGAAVGDDVRRSSASGGRRPQAAAEAPSRY